MQVNQTRFHAGHGPFEHVEADFPVEHRRIRNYLRGSSIRSASRGSAESSTDAQPSGRVGEGVGFR